MKKFLTIILVIMTACCLFSACDKETESTPKKQKPINPVPPASSVQEGDPEFPGNGFETDNESVYPGAWN